MSITTNEIVISDDVRAFAILQSGDVTGLEEIIWLGILDTMLLVEQHCYDDSSDCNELVIYLDESKRRLQLMQTEGAIPVIEVCFYRYSGWGDYSTGYRSPYQGWFEFHDSGSTFLDMFDLVDESLYDMAFDNLLRDGIPSLEGLDSPTREVISRITYEIQAYLVEKVKSRII